MKFPAKALLAGLGLMASGLLWSGAASAQYYGGYERPRGYDRGDGYERRGYDNRRGYDDRRGYDNRRGYDDRRGDGYGRGNAVNRMSIEEQKQALKNHREAQKKAIKRGYVLP